MSLALHCIGVEFRDVPPHVRERVALTPDDVVGLLDRARLFLGATEAVVLATCNRTELYVVESGDIAGLDLWHRTIGRDVDGRCPAVAAGRYHLQGTEVVDHLLRVAAGIDARPLGDTEIVGQIRRARDLAAGRGTVGTVLHRLFDVASRTGRRARAETAIAAGGAGVGASVAELVARRLGDRGVVAVLGAGNAADAVCRELRQAHGDELELRIVNRTLERAVDLADRHLACAFPLDQLPLALAGTDVVVCALHHDGAVVDHDLVGAVRSLDQDWRPLVIDSCVRPTVVPGVDLEVVDLGDDEATRAESWARRASAVPAAEAIVAEELDAFVAWHRERALDDVIADLYREAEAVTLEASRSLRDDAARVALRRAVRQLVHHHATNLRAVQRDVRTEKENCS